MTDRQADSLGLNADVAPNPIREAGSVGLNVDVRPTNIQRRAGSVGLTVEVVPSVIQRQADSFGLMVDVAPLVPTQRQVASVGLSVDAVINPARQLASAGVNVDAVFVSQRTAGSVGVNVDFVASSSRWAGSAGVMVDFLAQSGARTVGFYAAFDIDIHSRRIGGIGAQIDLANSAVSRRQTGGVAAQVDLRNVATTNRQTGGVGVQVDIATTAVAQRRTGAVAVMVDARIITPRVVPVTAIFKLPGLRTIPARAAISGVGLTVVGFTGRIGLVTSEPGRIEPGNPSGGYMMAPQPTRNVPLSGAFARRNVRTVPAAIILGGPGPTSALGLPWSSLRQYERVGLLAGPWARTVPISAVLASITTLRTTQATIEVLTTTSPNLRTTQAALEALIQGNPNVRTTQAAVEVLTRITITGSRNVPIQAALLGKYTRSVPIQVQLAFAHTPGPGLGLPIYIAAFASFSENASQLGIRPARLGAGFVLGVAGGAGPLRRERTIPAAVSLAYLTTHAVVTQAGMDIVFASRGQAVITQAAIEVLEAGSHARVTQAPLEVLSQGNRMRVTQAAVEVLWARVGPRFVPMSAAFSATRERPVPTTALFNYAYAQAVPATARLKGTLERAVHINAAFWKHQERVVPASLVYTTRRTRTVPISVQFLGPATRTVPIFRAMSWTRTRVVPVHAVFSSVTSYVTITQPTAGTLWKAPSFTVSGTSNGVTTNYVHYTLTDVTTGAVGGAGSNATVNPGGSWTGTQNVGFPPDWNPGDTVRLDVELRAIDGTVLTTASVTGHLGFTLSRTVPINAFFSSSRQHIDRWVPFGIRTRRHRDILVGNVSAYLDIKQRIVPFSASFRENKRTVPISANFYVLESTINNVKAVLRYIGWAIPASVELSSPTLIIKPVQAVLGEDEPHDERIGYTYVPGTSGGGISGAIYDDGWVPVWWQYYWAGAPQRISCNVISTAGNASRYDFNWIAWGNNTYNQLAYTATNMVVQHPVNIEARRRYHRVYPGQDFALGMSQGTLFHWGTNNFGQRSENVVSDGFLEPRTVFTYADPPPPQGKSDPYIGLPPIQQAGCGQSNCVAMDVNGGVWTWGRSDMNQTGWGAAVPGAYGTGTIQTQYGWSPAPGGVNTVGAPIQTYSRSYPNPNPQGQTVRIAGVYHTDITGPNMLWIQFNINTGTPDNPLYTWNQYPLLQGAAGTMPGQVTNTGAVDVPGDYPYDLTVALDSGTESFIFFVTNYGQTGNASIDGTIVIDPDHVPATPVLYPDCKTIPSSGQQLPTNIYTQPFAKLVDSLGPARFVTCCEQATVVLCQDNTLWVAGVLGTPGPLPPDDNTGRPYTPVNEIGFSQIAHGIGDRIMRARGGRFHIALVTETGALWMVGANNKGQLGTGDTADRDTPVLVASGVADAAPFGDSTMVMFQDGTVACCGDNSDGQCGVDIFSDSISSLVTVTVPPVEAISYGCLAHTAMVVLQQTTNPDIGDAESEVWGWGRNNMYQLQTGGTDSSASPAKVTDQIGITQMTLSADAVYATDENYKDKPMTLEHWRSWGRWDTGALGAGRAFHQYQAALPPPPPAPDVDPTDPEYIAWQSAVQAVTHTEPGPQMIGNSEKFAGFYVVRGRIDGGTALDRLGRVHAWGRDDVGQMGTGAESTVYSPYWKIGGWSPIPVPNIISAWMGWAWGNSNFVRTFEGPIMAWGDNSQFQLGLGHNQGDVWLGNNSVTLPTSIPSLQGADIQKMVGNDTLSLALLYDGRMLVAGTDTYGLVGPPGTVYPEFTLVF